MQKARNVFSHSEWFFHNFDHAGTSTLSRECLYNHFYMPGGQSARACLTVPSPRALSLRAKKIAAGFRPHHC